MRTLQTVVNITWIIFWVFWLVSAIGAKKGAGNGLRIGFPGLSVVTVIVLFRAFRGGALVVHSLVIGLIGAVVFACGITFAVWARAQLGRNWGMPMTQKAEPELVTSGPYRFVRHPIYTGILAGLLGTVLVTNLAGVIIVGVLGAYFYYAASVEEKNLTTTFPSAYPAYRESTKMLIPFVL